MRPAIRSLQPCRNVPPPLSKMRKHQKKTRMRFLATQVSVCTVDAFHNLYVVYIIHCNRCDCRIFLDLGEYHIFRHVYLVICRYYTFAFFPLSILFEFSVSTPAIFIVSHLKYGLTKRTRNVLLVLWLIRFSTKRNGKRFMETRVLGASKSSLLKKRTKKGHLRQFF